jgi:hypothetical protein
MWSNQGVKDSELRPNHSVVAMVNERYCRVKVVQFLLVVFSRLKSGNYLVGGCSSVDIPLDTLGRAPTHRSQLIDLPTFKNLSRRCRRTVSGSRPLISENALAKASPVAVMAAAGSR